MQNAISVDVEDYFHPSEVQRILPASQWDGLPSRVEASTQAVLDLFAERQVLGTFFILGWVAERFPSLVRRIAEAGHEIGCHSYAHQLVYDLTPAQFREDTLQAIRCIEDACGITPRLYRAPSYSITQRSLWALDIIAECGFTHDSSIYPIAHDRYGIPGFPRHAHLIQTPSGPLMEIPIATAQLSAAQVTPIGGGAYLRLLPYRYTSAGIRRVNRLEAQPICLYMHPWEIDPDQPRLAKGVLSRMRTYMGLRSMQGKLDRLMREFSFTSMGRVYPHPAQSLVSKSAAASATAEPLAHVIQE